jgi:CheY-like chemotaxis protein
MAESAYSITRKIIYVGDDPNTLKVITTTLRKIGIETRGVTSAEEGLELVTNSKPDMVLVDIDDASVDSEGFGIGYEFLRILNMNLELRLMQVLIIARKRNPDEISRFSYPRWWVQPPPDYMNKPLHADDLVEKVVKALSNARSL